MSRYEAHPTDDGKFQSTFDGYGHGEGQGITRQSVNRHFRKMEKLQGEVKEVLQGGESHDSQVEEPDESTSHDWLNLSDEEVGKVKVSSIPSPARSILSAFSSHDQERTKEEVAIFQRKQAKMIRYLFSGVVDPLASAYCRGVMGERGKDWSITRTPEDWELFESVTESWIEYHEFTLPMNPDVLMIGCLGAYYGPPIVHAHKNPDPERRGAFSKLKGRFIKWRAKRRLKKLGVEEFE